VRHGFKAQAERLSAAARASLGLSPVDPIDAWAYASHIGVAVLDFQEIVLSDRSRERLLVSDSESWSGMTLQEGEFTFIVINPSHALVRRVSTLMHELAHFILKHVPVRVDVSSSGMLLLSDYSDEAEAEADWLAAAILIPREALVRRRRAGETAREIAAMFGVSEQLCEWRLRMTGVNTQLRRATER
jgi:Zn-dependent peptidase ImmA (M78 family)